MELNRYILRFNFVEGFSVEALKGVLSKQQSGYIFVREVAPTGNVHLHGYLEGPIRDQALRKALKRAFPLLVGNGGYSIKKFEDSENKDGRYWRYICKGAQRGSLPDVVLAQGMNAVVEKVEEFHVLYWDTAAEIDAQKAARKATAGTLVETVYARCKESKVDALDQRKIAGLVFDELIIRARGVDVHRVRSATLAIQGMLDATDDVKSQVVDQAFPPGTWGDYKVPSYNPPA